MLCVCMYIYIIYTPNLGFEIAVSVRRKRAGPLWREQQGSKGEQRASLEGAWESNEGARGSGEGAAREAVSSSSLYFGYDCLASMSYRFQTASNR